MRSYLTQIEPDGTLGGDIATEWSATPDASEWTFKLNTRATFHDGSKVTANDVIASLNHHRGEASTSAAKALLSGVVELVDGGDSVTIKLDPGLQTCLGSLPTIIYLCVQLMLMALLIGKLV